MVDANHARGSIMVSERVLTDDLILIDSAVLLSNILVYGVTYSSLMNFHVTALH